MIFNQTNHFYHITKNAFCYLKNIVRLRHSLSSSAAENTHPRLHHLSTGLRMPCSSTLPHQRSPRSSKTSTFYSTESCSRLLSSHIKAFTTSALHTFPTSYIVNRNLGSANTNLLTPPLRCPRTGPGGTGPILFYYCKLSTIIHIKAPQE